MPPGVGQCFDPCWDTSGKGSYSNDQARSKGTAGGECWCQVRCQGRSKPYSRLLLLPLHSDRRAKAREIETGGMELSSERDWGQQQNADLSPSTTKDILWKWRRLSGCPVWVSHGFFFFPIYDRPPGVTCSPSKTCASLPRARAQRV